MDEWPRWARYGRWPVSTPAKRRGGREGHAGRPDPSTGTARVMGSRAGAAAEEGLWVKATGIVRRIDDLGRIVIPKEIRRTLRIREGDPLEIFVDRDGEVILKKYSPIGELGDFAKEYADSLHETVGHIALIADRDAVIAVAGAPKKEFLDKRVGSAVELAMQQRELVRYSTGSPVCGSIAGDDEDARLFASYVIAPITSGSEAVGAVILASREGGAAMGDMEAKLAETAAGFLARQMAQ